MLRFSWEYDHARGGAMVSVTYGDGVVEEVGLVNNGNVAQILCDALIARCSGQRDGSVKPWLGYVNPPRPRSLTPEDEDDNERTALSRRGLY